MSLFVADQAITFLLTVAMGMVMALIYDVMRMERRLFRHRNWFINLQDFIYFVFGGIFIFYILFNKNYGQIRAFSLIGALIGVILYLTICSEWIMKIGTKILEVLIKPIAFVLRIILFPFCWVGKMICKFMARCLTKSKRWVKIREKKVKGRIRAWKKRRSERDEKDVEHQQNHK